MRLTFALSLCLLVGCESAPVPSPTSGPEPERYTRVDGGLCQLPAASECRAILLFFVGHDCPISNGYAPEINRIVKDYAPKGVHCCIVYAEPDLKQTDAHRHAKDYGYAGPVIVDPALKLARQVGATVIPEAAVLSPTQTLLYLGRIDNRYADYGKLRPMPTQTEVRDALDAILAGRPVPVRRAPAIGCDIDFKK